MQLSNLFAEFCDNYQSAVSCGECNRNPQFKPGEVSLVLWGKDCDPNHDDGTNRWWLVKLTDGSYGILHEWTDYTGHRCQCGGFTGRYNSLKAALDYGITDRLRQEAQEALTAAGYDTYNS